MAALFVTIMVKIMTFTNDPDSLIPKFLQHLNIAEHYLSVVQTQSPTENYPCETLQKLVLEFSPETKFSLSIAERLDISLGHLKSAERYLRERRKADMTDQHLWDSLQKLQELIKELEAKS